MKTDMKKNYIAPTVKVRQQSMRHSICNVSMTVGSTLSSGTFDAQSHERDDAYDEYNNYDVEW